MPAGRPPKYETPEAMQTVIDRYFAQQFADEKPVTISGLAYELGMSTEALRNYGEKDEFLETVKRAKQRVEMFLEERLLLANATGPIFNLKNNFGWKDKTEQEHSGSLAVEAIERVIVDPE